LNQDESVAISGGRFLRKDCAYRNWATIDGAPGPKRHREGTEIPLFPLAFELGQLKSKVLLASRNDRARRLREDLAKFSLRA